MPTRTDSTLLPVAIYARYSTERQDARSIDDQIRRCRAYATLHGQEVVEEFKDAAVSGAHVDRVDMQRLLKATTRKGGSLFRAVLVDDLSRLSRDLGNTWRIVFDDLASANVKVIDVTTGLSSDGAGARLTFGAMALVNDTFLQLVKSETHRGLEGRALGGFWTGGRVYGYATVQEENPPDAEHPRKRPVIDPKEKEIVLRVFRLFSEGLGLKAIASVLNADGIAAPNDGGRGNKNGNGWGHSTIRAMLENERYLGRFVWNQSKWVRVPGRRSRRRIMRPESEWIAQEVPELAIVPKELWEQARARFRRVKPGKYGRPPGSGKSPSVLSGLLRCGVCGGSMTVVGRKWKAGVAYTRFGCTAHYSRGNAICANALTLSENKAQRAIVAAIRAILDQPEAFAHFQAAFRRQVGARSAAGQGAGPDLARSVRDAEKRVANLTESLARGGWSEALAAKLVEEERRLEGLKGQRAVAPRPAAPGWSPTPLRSTSTCATFSRWSKETPSADARPSPATSGRS